MAEVIRMPLLSDTMTEGVIVEWHKKVGDKVQADDVIAEVETDKATMDVMPYVEGTLLYIGVKKGEAAPVNGIIAVIGEEGEDYKALLEEEENEEDKASSPEKAEHSTQDDSSESGPASASSADLPSEDEATVIRMPLLSDTMKEGQILNWMKKEGEKVASDEPICEVETDKASMEVMPYVDGTLLYIDIPVGEAAKINQMIAIIGKEGVDISALIAKEHADQKAKDQGGSQPKEKETKEASANPHQEANPADASSSSAQNATTNDDRIKASPLAKRMAKDKGISLKEVTGTGEGGRIVKRDIENYTPSAKASSVATAGAPLTVGQVSYEDIPLTQMRKTVARRLSESKYSAPHFYLTMSFKMDEAMAARKAMNEISPTKISFNDLLIKAVAMSLKQHPEVNSSFMGDFIRQNHHISIGTAVAIPEGLMVPVIKFADTKTLSQIASESSALIQKARDKKLQPEEFTGNTFTISNLGMMDIDEFTAIINPPDSCILAVGKINPEAVVEEGEVVVRNIMKVTLSCDHRVVDGAKGAAFLQTLKALVENPINMLV